MAPGTVTGIKVQPAGAGSPSGIDRKWITAVLVMHTPALSGSPSSRPGGSKDLSVAFGHSAGSPRYCATVSCKMYGKNAVAACGKTHGLTVQSCTCQFGGKSLDPDAAVCPTATRAVMTAVRINPFRIIGPSSLPLACVPVQ